MIMLMMIMQQRSQPVVSSGSPWGWGQPPYYYY
jgi:hypothetical protein